MGRIGDRFTERERSTSWRRALADAAAQSAVTAAAAATLLRAPAGDPWSRRALRTFGGVLLGSLLPRAVALSWDRVRRGGAARRRGGDRRR